jgi:hypothetical protein
MRLDQYIPDWDMHEVHSLRIGADTDRVMAAVAAVTWQEAWLARFLPRLIGNRLPEGEPIIDSFGGLAGALDRQLDEYVFGAIDPMAGDSPTIKGLSAPDYRGFTEPGHAKIAFNFCYRAGVLRTETRIAVTDPGSRFKFRVYWALIRVGSGLTRISMLRAIRRRALQTTRTSGT